MTVQFLLIWLRIHAIRKWKELTVLGVVAALVVLGYFVDEPACMSNCGLFGSLF